MRLFKTSKQKFINRSQLYRLFAFYFLAAIYVSCRTTEQLRLVPKEFQYNEDSIGAGKKFTYFNSQNNRYQFADLKWVFSDNKKLKLLLRYNSDFKLDSVLEFNGRPYEIYYQLSVFSPQMFKGIRTRYSKRSAGHKIFKQKQSVIFRTDTLSMKLSSKSTYLKDTLMLWNGNFVPCVVIKTIGTFKDKSGKSPITRGTQRTLLYGYYAKDIGRIKYSTTSTYNNEPEISSTWELISIQNLDP